MLLEWHIIVTETTKNDTRKEKKDMMQEKEKRILENFALIIPKLSESNKSYLLGLGEGMAMKVNKEEKENEKK